MKFLIVVRFLLKGTNVGCCFFICIRRTTEREGNVTVFYCLRPEEGNYYYITTRLSKLLDYHMEHHLCCL